jgi:hypothetical protein
MRRPFAVLCALLLCAACSEPPQKELDMAQGAIDAARAAGADQYARESFAGASSALDAANQAVAQRDYRLALSHAIDARQRAHEAAKQAADGKARVRSEAESAIVAAAVALDDLRQRLKAAEAAKLTARELAPARAAALDAEGALQKARAAIKAETYLDARAAVAGAKQRITNADRQLTGAIEARRTRKRR